MTVISPGTAYSDWLIVSVAGDNRWLVTLSGIAFANFQGTSATDWRRDTLIINSTNMAISAALGDVSPALPPPINIPGGTRNFFYGFDLIQWANFATINAIYGERTAQPTGYAADRVDVILSTHKDVNGNDHNQWFDGISVDMAVRDNKSILYRVGYNVTLLGSIFEYSDDTMI